MMVSSNKEVREAVKHALDAGCTIILNKHGKAKLKSPTGMRVMLVPLSPTRNGHAMASWLHAVKKLMES